MGPPATPSVFSGNYQMGPDESGWEPKGPIQDLNAAPVVPASQQAVAQSMAPQAPPMQGPVSPGTPARARTPEERRDAIIELMANQHPQAQALGKLLSQQDFMQQEKDENRQRFDATA